MIWQGIHNGGHTQEPSRTESLKAVRTMREMPIIGGHNARPTKSLGVELQAEYPIPILSMGLCKDLHQVHGAKVFSLHLNHCHIESHPSGLTPVTSKRKSGAQATLITMPLAGRISQGSLLTFHFPQALGAQES